jgi:hypothetical protein
MQCAHIGLNPRLTMFLYSSRASASSVSAPVAVSMISPYWFRTRYVGMAPFVLEGLRNSSVLVNSLLRAPGNRTLSGLVLNRSWSHHQTILLSTRRRRNTPRPSGRALHDGSRAIDGRGRSKTQGPQTARGIAERHFAECRLYIAVRGLRYYRIRGRQVKGTASFGSRGSRPTPDETGADSSSRMTRVPAKRRARHVLMIQSQNNFTDCRRIGCSAMPPPNGVPHMLALARPVSKPQSPSS